MKIGLTAGDLNGGPRPLIAILWTGKTPTMPGRPRHQYAERITIYVETADVEDAMERLVELVEDVEEALKTNEMLKTAAAPWVCCGRWRSRTSRRCWIWMRARASAARVSGGRRGHRTTH